MAVNDLKDSAVVPMLAEQSLESARRFWEDALGLEMIWGSDAEGEMIFRAGQTVFGVYEHKGGSKADHTQMVFQVTDVSEAKQRLEDKGVRFEDYDLPGLKTQNGIADMGEGGQAAWFLDPGGNIIGVMTESSKVLDTLGVGSGMTGAGIA